MSIEGEVVHGHAPDLGTFNPLHTIHLKTNLVNQLILGIVAETEDVARVRAADQGKVFFLNDDIAVSVFRIY